MVSHHAQAEEQEREGGGRGEVWRGGSSRALACAWRPFEPVPTRQTFYERIGGAEIPRWFVSVEPFSREKDARILKGCLMTETKTSSQTRSSLGPATSEKLH